MKMLTIFAVLGAALSLPATAFAADAGHQPSGHYEWRQTSPTGPRATGPSQQRVWVPDAQAANCDCRMMNERALAGMHDLRDGGSGSSVG